MQAQRWVRNPPRTQVMLAAAAMPAAGRSSGLYYVQQIETDRVVETVDVKMQMAIN